MRFFLDTNILIDLMTMRHPFGRNAVDLFIKAKSERWELYTSALSVATTFYIASKSEGIEKSKKIIASLLNIIEIIPADRNILMNAVSSRITDYEDAIQHGCAIKIKGMTGIITRDKRDFKQSSIPVFSPEEALIL